LAALASTPFGSFDMTPFSAALPFERFGEAWREVSQGVGVERRFAGLWLAGFARRPAEDCCGRPKRLALAC
jgi:hypothetical protein